MKISALRVQNFRSLLDIELSKLGDLVVLAGKNSSGKSNLLEAMSLFFSEFEVTGGETEGLSEQNFARAHPNEPAMFTANLLLNKDELNSILPQSSRQQIATQLATETPFIEVVRELRPLGPWTTVSLNLSGLELIKNDSVLIPNLFQPRQTVVREVAGEGPRIVIQDSGLRTNLTNVVKGCFNLVSVARDGKGTERFRPTISDETVRNDLWNLSQSQDFAEGDRYSGFESVFERLSGLRLYPTANKTMIRKGPTRTWLNYEGGGIQASTNLLFDVFARTGLGKIVAVEEPENHLHPELQRILTAEFAKFAKGRQVFLSTHSPTVVDAAGGSDVRIVRLDMGYTRVLKTDEMSKMLDCIGARPSDAIFNDKIVFVEGESDKIVLTAFAKKLRLELNGVEFIPLTGKSNSARALKVCVGTCRNVIPFFLILDNDAQSEVDELKESEKLDESQIHVWKRGSIEQYYPEELLAPAFERLNAVYKLGIDIPETLKKVRDGELRLDKISLGGKEDLLKPSWEVALAREIAKQIETGVFDIPVEMQSILTAATAKPY